MSITIATLPTTTSPSLTDFVPIGIQSDSTTKNSTIQNILNAGILSLQDINTGTGTDAKTISASLISYLLSTIRLVPQITPSFPYTVSPNDLTKHIILTGSSNGVVNLPTHGGVPDFPIGFTFMLINTASSNGVNLSIRVASDTLILEGFDVVTPSGGFSTINIAQYGRATLLKTATNTWFVYGTNLS